MDELQDLGKKLDELAEQKAGLQIEASSVHDELFGENGLYAYVRNLPDRFPGKMSYLERILELGKRIPAPLLADASDELTKGYLSTSPSRGR